MTVLYSHPDGIKKSSAIHSFQDHLNMIYNAKVKSYEEMWEWSINNIPAFWNAIAEKFQIIECIEKNPIEDLTMPGAVWYKDVKINYGEYLCKEKDPDDIALISYTEEAEPVSWSWAELLQKAGSIQNFLKKSGVKKGDTVAAIARNTADTSAAFLAAVSMGAIWSSCSPDFGKESIEERFSQIKPKVLFAHTGYSYNGKRYDRREIIHSIAKKLMVQHVVKLDNELSTPMDVSTSSIYAESGRLEFEKVDFNDPLWVLYSSGTTGKPKAITHSHGGTLLEHVKYMHLQNDVREGERFFWYSTTGWMMWNFLHAAWFADATIVLYDGSAGHKGLDRLWKLTDDARITHMGVGAPYLITCMREGLDLQQYNFSRLRSIGSTGSPLPPEAFDWVYKNVKEDVWLCSMSGGTDVCTAFVGSTALKPVIRGEIQCRALGAAVFSVDENGDPVTDEVGEMIISKPMPSMPVFFWNDPDMDRYRKSYFENYEGMWRHGDYIKITSQGGVIIYGRSDATLNRQGVRIGTSEIYRSVNAIPQVEDSIIVNIERPDGSHYMPLFVKLRKSHSLDSSLLGKIKMKLKKDYSPRHVPDAVIEVKDIPYTISGKKMETPVKKILMGKDPEKSINRGAMKNPDAADIYINYYREKLQ